MDVLRRSKKAYKRHFEQKVANLKEMLQDPNAKNEELDGMKQYLDKKWPEIEKTYKEIIDQLAQAEEEEALTTEVDEMENLRYSYITETAKIAWRIKKEEPKPKKEEESHSSKSLIRLPRLELPIFDGDICNWKSFADSFEALVHQCKDIPNVEKFRYLEASLKGDAAKCIKGLQATNENYPVAVALLKETYDRPEEAIETLYKRLSHILPMYDDSSDTLQKFVLEIQSSVNSLQALGVQQNSYGAYLKNELVEKLPQTVLMEWNRHIRSMRGEEKNLDTLLAFLKSEVKIRSSMKRTSDAVEEMTTQFNNGMSFTSSTAALPAIASSRQIYPCIFCQSAEHQSFKCHLGLAKRKAALTQQGRCFKCLKKNHLAKHCPDTSRSCRKCSHTGHHTTICHQEGASGRRNELEEVIQTSVQTSPMKRIILLQTAQAIVKGMKRTEKIRILLDGGSQRSFILQEFARKIGAAPVAKEKLKIHSFGGGSREQYARRVRVLMKGANGAEQEMEFLETDQICGNVPQLPDGDWREKFLKSGVQLADDGDNSSRIDALIGADQYWNVVYNEVQRLENGLVAVNSFFGSVLHGAISVKEATVPTHVMLLTTEMVDTETTTDKALEADLKRFFAADEEQLDVTAYENELFRKFEETVEYKEGCYEVEFPWSQDKKDLPCNVDLAEDRLWWQVRRMKRNGLLQAYHEQIEGMISEGFLEEIPVKKKAANDANAFPVPESIEEGVHYIPHHAVVRPDKETTKVRMVLDAAAKRKGGRCINDFLHVGPLLNPMLIEVILKARKHRVAFSADISKAFLRVGLKPKDRDSVRILWVNDPDAEKKELRHLRFKRVPFGLKPSLYLLRATILHHIKKYENQCREAVEIVRENLFVDDLLAGADTEEEAFELCRQISFILEEAGMPITKWKSNSEKLNELFRRARMVTEGNPNCRLVSKVLGLQWDMKKDVYSFDVQPLIDYVQQVRTITKRIVLAISARIFDPLGILTPSMLKAKLMLRSLCELNLGWDDEVPGDIKQQFESWFADLKAISNLSVNRWYGTYRNSKMKIDVYCDASNMAYGAVAYLRTESCTSFLLSKARIAPLRRASTPRLELTGCLLAAELASFLRSIFKITEADVRIMSDSEVALAWVIGKSSKEQFVRARVSKIEVLVSEDQWLFCPGAVNPADIVSRGMSANKLSQSIWLKGPNKIQREQLSKPKKSTTPQKDNLSEVAVQSVICQPKENGEEIIDVNRFSNWSRLIRTMAWVFRAIKKLKTKQRPTTEHQRAKLPELEMEEIKRAKVWVIKKIQQEAFHSEIERLLRRCPMKKSSNLQSLQPYLDADGVMRMRARTIFSEIKPEVDPVILPAKHYLVALIIRCTHNKIGHAGVRQTLTEVRDEFWIIRGRDAVKQVVGKCVKCRRTKARTFQQPMAPLPADRCSVSQAFDVIGVDYAGPIFVKIEKSVSKCYICLFTCAATRAIHLEAVYNLSTTSFLTAFRKFVSRRGMPRKIYSDNATTFKGAENELKANLSNHGVEWNFIAELAPWWGGFWERLVRTVKSHLKRTLGSALVNWIEFEALLCQVEAIVNSRPLTYTYNEANEAEPLAPNHLLIGRRSNYRVSPTTLPTTMASSKEITQQWSIRQSLVNEFWKHWSREYLQELAKPSKPSMKPTHIKIGAVVLVGDNNILKQNWKLGVIEEVEPGRDGVIRSAIVRTTTGRYRRAVQLLSPLETEMEVPASQTGSKDELASEPRMDEAHERAEQLTNQQPEKATSLDARAKVTHVLGGECCDGYVTRSGRRSKRPNRYTD